MNGKGALNLFLLSLAGLALGGFIGHYLGQYGPLQWLNYGRTFGLSEPFILDMGIIRLTFGIMFDISVSSLVGIGLGILVYKRM
ncbi:MAG: DUF4321 domain-containing protein [Clostridiales bacterium]|jgi:hypothetical protein|nr:DUF4321 domain-containing protein [Clostridiales bacterium]